MKEQTTAPTPMSLTTPEQVMDALVRCGYVADKQIATVLFLFAHLSKPLLIEGPAGVGKTSLARVWATITGGELFRLQCYPGIDESKALYQWNYHKQLLYIQATAANACNSSPSGSTSDPKKDRQWQSLQQEIFSFDFLLARPVLNALLAGNRSVLLIDEVDKSDEEFESFLLEALSEFQVSIPEMGTIKAQSRPYVILTSNNSRELSDALRRRCLYLYLDFPPPEREQAIINLKYPALSLNVARQMAIFLRRLRRLELKKTPSIAETLDWAQTLLLLGAETLKPDTIRATLNVLLKHQEDLQLAQNKLEDLTSHLAEQNQQAIASRAGEENTPSQPLPPPNSTSTGGEAAQLDLSRFNF